MKRKMKIWYYKLNLIQRLVLIPGLIIGLYVAAGIVAKIMYELEISY